MYNLRTISIESKLISPLCNSILTGEFELFTTSGLYKAVSQTLVDESYHTLLSVDGCKKIIEARGLENIELNQFNFLRNIQEECNSVSDIRKKELIALGVAISSEVLISDYLAIISTSNDIQPFCREITKIHWRDELLHSNIFKLIAKHSVDILSKRDKDYLLNIILVSSKWFCDKELDLWKKIFSHVGVESTEDIFKTYSADNYLQDNLFVNKKITALINQLNCEKGKCHVN